MTINDRFKTLREKLKLSQNEMAHKMGTDQASVSKIENNKLNLTVENIQKLHDSYGINLNWLLCGEGKMKEGMDFTVTNVKEDPSPYGNQKHLDYLIELQKKTIEKLEAENEQLTKRLEERQNNGATNKVKN